MSRSRGEATLPAAERIARWIERENSIPARNVELIRIVYGLIGLSIGCHMFWRQFPNVLGGGYFNLPLVPWLGLIPVPIHRAIVASIFPMAVLFICGIATRWTALGIALVISYAIFFDWAAFHHNFFLGLVYFLLLAVIASPRPIYLLKPSPGGSEIALQPYAVFSAKAFTALVYLFAGLSKLTPAYFSGIVVAASIPAAWRDPSWFWQTFFPAVSHLMDPHTFFRLLSMGSVCAELFLAFALPVRKLRPAAFVIGALFHLGIQLAMNIQTFNFYLMASYLFYAFQPRERARVSFNRSSAFFRLARRFDFLHNLEWEEHEGVQTQSVEGARVSTSGPHAIWLVITRVPALNPIFLLFAFRFVIYLPLWFLRAFTSPRWWFGLLGT